MLAIFVLSGDAHKRTMPKVCQWGQCESNSDKNEIFEGKPVLFARFPQKKKWPVKCRTWVQACNSKITYLKVGVNSYVCSKHFPDGNVNWKENHNLVPFTAGSEEGHKRTSLPLVKASLALKGLKSQESAETRCLTFSPEDLQHSSGDTKTELKDGQSHGLESALQSGLMNHKTENTLDQMKTESMVLRTKKKYDAVPGMKHDDEILEMVNIIKKKRTMPKVCQWGQCESNSDKNEIYEGKPVLFARFPQKKKWPIMCRIWARACNSKITYLKVGVNSYVCSKHFPDGNINWKENHNLVPFTAGSKEGQKGISPPLASLALNPRPASRKCYKAKKRDPTRTPGAPGDRYCVAVGCYTKQTDVREGKAKFYSFSKVDLRQRELWEKAVNRKDWKAKDNDRLCSKHFPFGKRSDDPDHPCYSPTIFPTGEHTSPY